MALSLTWKHAGACFGIFALLITMMASNAVSPNMKHLSSLYDTINLSNIDVSEGSSNLSQAFQQHHLSSSSSSSPSHSSALVAEVEPSSGGISLEENYSSITPAPEVIASQSQMQELYKKALEVAKRMPKTPCDYTSLRSKAVLNMSSGLWTYPTKKACDVATNRRNAKSAAANKGNASSHSIPLPVDGEAIIKAFANKRILFMGDSVARNSFVLTMARMCNPLNYDRCITRCPTMEYDIVNPPQNRGPMGCVPNTTTTDAATGETILVPPPATAKSRCYSDGKFASIPLKGLTLRSVPQDRNGRRNFIRKGLIGPVLGMTFSNVTLLYLPVTKPAQLTRAGLWMERHPGSIIHADVVIMSIGPHLRLPEVQATPETLIQGLSAVRAASDVPIIAAEFVHALGSQPSYVKYVDDLMDNLRAKMAPLRVSMIPQRFITKHGFMLSSGKMTKSEAEGTVQKGCGYYDPQHPALRCQMATSDMLLAAAIAEIVTRSDA